MRDWTRLPMGSAPGMGHLLVMRVTGGRSPPQSIGGDVGGSGESPFGSKVVADDAIDGGPHATDRPAGRDELAVDRRVLPDPQRAGGRAARGSALGALPAVLGRLRGDRGDAGRG